MLVVVILGMSTHTAHAIFGDMIGGFTLDAIGGILSVVFNVILGAVGFILALAGALLNISMYLTTHLGMFIDKTDAIYTTWNIVRDLSSILLIFIILYASIQMITGMKSADFGGMIKNIIIVGVLINFSFFFCRVMIDASNIISLQFYNAIAPSNGANNKCEGSTAPSSPPTTSYFPCLVKSLATDGGVSDAVMGQLNLTSWFGKGLMKMDIQNATIANSFSEDFHIVILSIGGIIVASITSLSFVAISAAALLRIAMLIFLIGFSPIWIASWAMPSLKKLTEQWTKQFYAQLVFLPTYMAFLYVALRVIVALQLNSIGDANATTGLASAINLFVGFGIAIVLLNIPIVAAIGVTAAVGGDSGMIEKFSKGARSWVKTAATRGAQNTWTNTGGRAARAISETEGLKKFASNWKVGEYTLKGMRGVAGEYNKKLDTQVKSRTDFADSLGHNVEQAKFHESELRDLRRQQGYLFSIGNKSGAKALNIRINEVQEKLRDVKTGRKENYANRINKGGADTLWTKVARKDKSAASKILSDVLKKRLEDANKALEKHRDNVKSESNSLEALKNKIMNQGYGANADQALKQKELEDKLTSLYNKEPDLNDKINAIEEQIENL